MLLKIKEKNDIPISKTLQNCHKCVQLFFDDFFFFWYEYYGYLENLWSSCFRQSFLLRSRLS